MAMLFAQCGIAQILDSDPFTNNQAREALMQSLGNYRSTFNNSRALAFGVSVGAVVEIGRKNNNGFRVFVAGSILKNFAADDLKIMAAWQSEIELFRGGIGSSEFKGENAKFNIEWRNNPQFIIGANNGNPIMGRPLNPSLGQSMSSLYDPLDYSLNLGCIFINGINHKRNQQLGYFQVGVVSFQMSYINDGPPYDNWFLPLGDEFDRYWTGNLDIGLYWLSQDFYVTNLGFRYTRFTGYEENTYELSDKFKLKNLLYRDPTVQFQNKGRYQYRLGFFNLGTLNISAYQPSKTGLQEYIHYKLNYPFHPNTTDTYWTVGTEFNYKTIYLD